MATRTNLLLPDAARWPLDEPVIELIGVSKSFGETEVIRDLSLTVQTGKTTVIAGESGSGKSVLLRMMNGLTLPDSGQVRLFGHDLVQADERLRTTLRKRCTMVFQSYALIDSLTVAQNIGFPLAENTSMGPKEIRALVMDLLEMLELTGAVDELPASLSGGMKKRVALARAVDGGRAYLHAWLIALVAIALSLLGLLFVGVGLFYTSAWAWMVVGYAFSESLSLRQREAI